MRASWSLGGVKHSSMRKIFCFKDPGPERRGIGIEAQGLVHENRFVSRPGS